MKNMLVFSHLRWDFVFQRPQHVMTRLAQHYRIYFFEEPMACEGAAFLEISQPADNIWVCRPHTPVHASGFHDDQLAVLQLLLDELLVQRNISRPVVWLYTPMALPLLQGLNPLAIVYDCMDELSAFKNAPKQLLQRESALLKVASVVFTGGLSLYGAKKSRHHAVYLFPSSVDKSHFSIARNSKIDHPDQSSIPHPRLGYYGVIDERIDLDLLSDLAQTHPEWQIVMVGPVVKIAPELLPRHANIHYLGQQRYEDLPLFLAGWDLCLLPFALNDATRFISPTKILEYMVAEKPIVSTPIRDVSVPYGTIAYVTPAPLFIAGCERALGSSSSERTERSSLMRAVTDATSWDATASAMHEVIEACPDLGVGELHALAESYKPTEVPVVIIGAGPTGLSAAYHYGEGSLIIEQNETVGGWCRSIEDHGFVFDHAGHIMFSNDPYVHQMYQDLLGDNIHWQNREAWIYSKKVYSRYPFQGALYGLPPEVVTECIMGAIEARGGSVVAPKSAANDDLLKAGSSAAACKAESITDCCADGVAGGPTMLASLTPVSPGAPRNFEEFIYRVWGSGIAKHFALPYNRKLWAVPLTEMETSWLGGRVPLPDLREMIEGALQPVSKPVGPNARFGYPLRGGFQALMNGFLPHLQGDLKLNARIARVLPAEHRVILDDGTSYVYEQLISTMPLPHLIKAIGHHAPAHIIAAAGRLRHVSVRCVNLGIGRANLTDKHWIYYPEAPVFHRIFVQGNASPHVNSANGFALTCEITYSPNKPLPCDGEALIDRCIADCIETGIIRADDPIIARNQIDMPYAYVVYDHWRAENVALIREWALAHDIILSGRYSEWEYYNSDHAFLAGRKAAESARAALAGSSGNASSVSRRA